MVNAKTNMTGNNMASGLFILLYDDGSLENCLRNGLYGFLMPPVYEEVPNSHSKHYAVLSDYACCEEGTEIFFFNKRTITYGGKITASNNGEPIFYLNGDTSPLGRKAHSHLYVDMSNRYETTDKKGVYYIGQNQRGEDRNRAMPFIIEFNSDQELTGKQIVSDELYFELGNYNYPFPSNTIQHKGFCTLTVKETKILLKLLKESDRTLTFKSTQTEDANINNDAKVLFKTSLLNETEPTNESHLEFLLLADSKKLDEIVYKSLPDIPKDDYIRCRQVPLCPFRPIQFDMADICLYSKNYPIKDFSLPNVIIELKNQPANFRAYEQVTKYLRWVKQIAPNEFDKVRAIIVAPSFTNTLNIQTIIKKGISTEYHDKIAFYSLDEDKVIEID